MTAIVSYWRKYGHLVLVNRLGSLPSNSVVRLTDRLDMTIVVDWDVKPQIKQTNKFSYDHLNNIEPPHDKTNNDCAPSEDSDQPGHPLSLIRVFAMRMKKAWVLSYPLSAQRRLWSDWADAQADLSLRWAHSHFVGIVMRRLILYKYISLCTSDRVFPFSIKLQHYFRF